MLRRVEGQPADVDSYIQTPYGVAAVRVDEVPAADEDEGLFGSSRATVPVSPSPEVSLRWPASAQQNFIRCFSYA